MKRRILEADSNRREKKVLTEQELEAQERAQAHVERASALRMEQEEEIRMLNKVRRVRVPGEDLWGGNVSSSACCCCPLR